MKWKEKDLIREFRSFASFWVPVGFVKQHRKKNKTKNRLPEIELLLPEVIIEEIFPGINSQTVDLIVAEIFYQPWVLPLTELLTISAICQYLRPDTIFEIGTYIGSTTLFFARNSPVDSKIFTLDLPPSRQAEYGIHKFDVGFRYMGSGYEHKIHQLHGDTMTFDYASYEKSVDLVFIDANHTYDYVKVDTHNAFKILKRGGVIIWDDYVWNVRQPGNSGVARLLNELSVDKKCFQIAGTRFGIYLDD
jgi:predicted O-methyltransferase YrrM